MTRVLCASSVAGVALLAAAIEVGQLTGRPVIDPPSEIGGRVARLLYLELVPGLRPLLRHHGEVTTEAVSLGAFRAVLAPVLAQHRADAPDAVILAERFAERGLLPADDE